MAISWITYQLLKEHAHLYKRGGSLLEFGEANWYGDMNPANLFSETEDEELRSCIRAAIESGNRFTIAKAVYRMLWAPSVCHAVDLSGTDSAFTQDLNAALKLPRKYDLVINNGTAEHIFNVAHVFKSSHDHVELGGYMVHESPFTGWVEHGFYTLQPTLYYDLARANEYEVVSVTMFEIWTQLMRRIEDRRQLAEFGKLITDAMLYVVLRKVVDKPFRVPIQGTYDNR